MGAEGVDASASRSMHVTASRLVGGEGSGEQDAVHAVPTQCQLLGDDFGDIRRRFRSGRRLPGLPGPRRMRTRRLGRRCHRTAGPAATMRGQASVMSRVGLAFGGGTGLAGLVSSTRLASRAGEAGRGNRPGGRPAAQVACRHRSARANADCRRATQAAVPPRRRGGVAARVRARRRAERWPGLGSSSRIAPSVRAFGAVDADGAVGAFVRGQAQTATADVGFRDMRRYSTASACSSACRRAWRPGSVRWPTTPCRRTIGCRDDGRDGVYGLLSSCRLLPCQGCTTMGVMSWNQLCACTKPVSFGDRARGLRSWTMKTS